MFAPLDVSALASDWAATFAAIAIKGMVVLALAFVGSILLRRAAASTRHLVWTAAVVGLLALPVLELAVPRVEMAAWTVPATGSATEGAAEDAVQRSAPAKDVTWLVRLDAVEGLGEPSGEPAPSAALARHVDRTDPTPTSIDASSRPVKPWNVLLDRARDWNAATWLLLAWEFGVLLVVGWLAAGWIGLRRLETRCRPVTDPDWRSAAEVAADEIGLRRVPTLLETDDAMTPLVWGVLRPKVLVPARTRDWTMGRRIDVLRHEFAHVQRRDVLTQLLAQVACAVFWFHPLPWIAAARMRLERERACDDRVLLAGSRASSYATHLLDMARTLRSEHGLAAASIGMARRSQLGERMDSLLDEAPRGRTTSRAQRVALIALGLALVLPLAAITPSTIEAAPPERDEARIDAPAPVVVGGLRPTRFPEPPRPSAGLASRPRSISIGSAPSAPSLPAITSAPLTVTADGFSFSFSDGARRLTQNGTAVFGADEVVTEHLTWSMTDGDLELEVEMDGRFRFAEDDSDVEIVSDEGYFDLYWEEGRDRRRMEIERDDDGTVERRYSVRGREAEIDDDARKWFADAVETFAVRAGIGVERRVDRWVREDGVDGAIDRIEEIDFDHPAATHWAELLMHDALDVDERQRVLARIERDVDSDFTMNRVLDRALVFLATEPALADGTIDLIASIDSDFERGRAIRMALELEGIDADLAERILILADGMGSDFEKTRVLIPGARLSTESRVGAPSDGWFRVLRGVDSDFERTRALIEALPLALDDADARAQMWEAIDEIDSDFEKTRVITALAPRLETDEMVIEALGVIDGIDSDFEKARALNAFVDVAARSDDVRDAFTRVADRIDSDHEYGRVMRSLEAAGR